MTGYGVQEARAVRIQLVRRKKKKDNTMSLCREFMQTTPRLSLSLFLGQAKGGGGGGPRMERKKKKKAMI